MLFQRVFKKIIMEGFNMECEKTNKNRFLSQKLSITAGIIFSALLVVPTQANDLLQVYQDAKTNDAQLKISEAGFLAALEE